MEDSFAYCIAMHVDWHRFIDRLMPVCAPLLEE